ncbi:MFS transporter [Pseudonocardia sp. NPDC049635]|uniref:MFS transporter n=1 Tax=Pseudonocardia sp. NPDC049635 TaxID=3155506 RepID=UPI00341021CE
MVNTSRLRVLRPFRLRAYRGLALALSMSMLTSGIWTVAMVWEVIRIGGGPAQVSLVATTATVVAIVAMPIGGVVADRVPQKLIMIGVHATNSVALGALAVPALAGQTRSWMLVTAAAVVATAGAFAFPAYSAWVPALVRPDDLLAVNGIEGVLRPTMFAAAGPAVAAAVIGVASPAAAVAVAATSAAVAVTVTATVPRTPVRRAGAPGAPGLRGAVADLRSGASFVVRTRWLAVTLPMASVMVLALMGPFQVVLPFLLQNDHAADVGAHAAAVAAFGTGGAVASLAVASLRFPRRYLTAIVTMWGALALPLAVIGLADTVVVVVGAAFVMGALFSAPNTLWGTILQRRVPPEFIGRVSSLDFLVSNTFTPASLALAGPLVLVIGAPGVFLIAALVTPVALVVVLLVGRLGRDETAHPLRDPDPVGAP